MEVIFDKLYILPIQSIVIKLYGRKVQMQPMQLCQKEKNKILMHMKHLMGCQLQKGKRQRRIKTPCRMKKLTKLLFQFKNFISYHFP